MTQSLNTHYLLAFISFEKYISIRFAGNKIMKKQWFQTLVIFIIFAANLIVYHSVFYLISFEKQEINNTKNISNFGIEFECYDHFEEIRLKTSIILFIYRTILPFISIMIFTTLLIYTIFKSQMRILRLANQHNRNRLRKDIQFAISSIFLNISYFLFQLPVFIFIFLSNDFYTDLYINFFIFLLCLNLGDHFYVLFCSNSIFHREVLILFRYKTNIRINIASKYIF